MKVKVIIAHYNEDLEWIKNLKYEYEVISRLGIPKEVFPNKGNEASAYLEFIIKNYYDLPDVCIFVHGHRNSWHHKQNMDEKLETLEFCHDYYNINDPEENGMLTELTREPFENELKYMNSMQSTLNFIRPNTNPSKIKYRNSAQFYVKKEAILKRSIKFYEMLYQWLKVSKDSSYFTSRFFEYTWHIIFTNEIEDKL